MFAPWETAYSPTDGPPRPPDDFEDFCSGSGDGAQSLARAREVVRRWAGSDLCVDELAHGSSGMLSFVVTDDRKKFFLKMAKQVTDAASADLRREYDNIGLAARSGVTTPPLYFDEAAAAMICPFVEGTRLSLAMAQDCEVIATVMREVGRMHDYGATEVALKPPDFVGGLAGVLSRFEGSFPEMAACARRAAQMLDLAYRQLPPVSPTLVHGDLHFGNVLWQGSRQVKLIDFFATHLGDPAGDIARWMLIGGIEVGQADSLVRLAHADPPPHTVTRVQLHLAAQHLSFSCRMARRLRPNEEACYFFNSFRHDLHRLQISCDLGAMESFMYSTCLSRLQRRAKRALSAAPGALRRGLGLTSSGGPQRLPLALSERRLPRACG